MGSEFCMACLHHEGQLKQLNLLEDQFQTYIVRKKGHFQIYSKSDNHLIYDGEMKNGKFHGYGKFYHEENKLEPFYEGQFKDGHLEGWGITQKYIGQFRENQYDGFGIYQELKADDKTKVTYYYEGQFSHGRYSGSGLQIKDMMLPVEKIKQIHDNQGMISYVQDSIEKGNLLAKKYGAKQIYIGQFGHGFRSGVGRLFKGNYQFNGTFLAGKTTEKGTVIDLEEDNKRKKREKRERCLQKYCINC